MSEDMYGRRILDNIPSDPPVVPRVDPATLDVDHEVTSADSLVTAVVNGPTHQVISVVVGRLDDLDAVGAAAVEAINKALDLAGGLSGLDERIAARMAAFDASMERITGRLENLAADLDGLLKAD
jgi:hypothetical protein